MRETLRIFDFDFSIPQLIRQPRQGVTWNRIRVYPQSYFRLEALLAFKIFLITLKLSFVALYSSSPSETPEAHSPITYVQPWLPIQTSCTRPASTSTLDPTPNVTFLRSASSGYHRVISPSTIRCVVSPRCEWGA